MAAVLGIAAIPTVSSGRLRRRPSEMRKSSKSKGRHAECKKSSTLIIHVYAGGGGPQPTQEEMARYPHGRPLEAKPVRISRVGPKDEVLSSIETRHHTVHVVPGQYEITALGGDGGTDSTSTKVALKADQQLEVTVTTFSVP